MAERSRPFLAAPPHGGRASLYRSGLALVAAAILFLVWTLATWLLEGRIGTFLRPGDVADRAIYAIVANLGIGTTGGVLLLSYLARQGMASAELAGFGRRAASPLALLVAAALGLGFHAVQGAPTWHPVILLNAFAQVLVVTVAEVVVCWALVGSCCEAALRPYGRAVSLVGAALVASLAFGAYHYAHSAPFNSYGMVLLLGAVGLVTGVFFLALRDVYATVLFHNFLGVYGVVNALPTSGATGAMQQVRMPLLVMAVAALGVLILCHRLVLARPVTP